MEADAAGYEPVDRRGKLVGFVASGGYGHTVQTSLAMAYVDTEVPVSAEDLTVTVLGKPVPGSDGSVSPVVE